MKRFTGKASLILILTLTAALMPGAAGAQLVDYAGLEKVFGEPVTTSATGKPQAASEAPVSMDIITAEEIRRSGALDIPEILRRYAGVDVARNYIGNADVSIRGYNQVLSNRLLVLINGRQFYQDIFGFTFWQNLPVQLSEIQQIEIVRGPNASLFGFNAASGVINIVTKSPMEMDVSNVEMRGGTQNYRSGSFVKTFREENAGIRLSAGRTLSDDYSRKDLTGRPSAEKALDMKEFHADSQFRLGGDTDGRIETGFSHQKSDALMLFQDVFNVNSYFKHIKADLHHDSAWGLWSVNTYINDAEYRFLFGDLQPLTPNVNGIKNTLGVMKISNLFSPAANHTMRLGGEFRDNIGIGGNNEFITKTYAANGMWDWRMTDAWSWTNAGRVDRWLADRNLNGIASLTNPMFSPAAMGLEPTKTEYSFNSGLVWRQTDVSTWRLSTARGAHIPSITELAREIHTPVYEAYGNPQLSAERNFTVDLGYTRKLLEQNMSWGVNGVYEKISNVIAGTIYPFDAPPPPTNLLADETFENVGSSESYLIELSAKGSLLDDRLTWHGNYTYTLVQDRPDGRANHFIDFENTQPRHKLNLSLGYTKDRFEADTDVHFVSATNQRGYVIDPFGTGRFSKRVPAYVILSGRVGYRLTDNTSISLDGYNLLDKHFERPAIAPSAAVLGVRGANEMGRTALLTLRQQF